MIPSGTTSAAAARPSLKSAITAVTAISAPIPLTTGAERSIRARNAPGG